MKALWITLVSLMLAGAGGYWYYKTKAPNRAALVQQVVYPEIRDILVTVQATGVIEPENKVEILPPVAGRLDEIAVEEGETVKRNQQIALMSSTQRAALLDIAHLKSGMDREILEKTYQPTPVFAPVAGRIIRRAVVQGQTVTTQTVLFEMSDRLVVRAQVDETDLALISAKMEAKVSVDAYPNQSWQAVVSRIAQQSRAVNNVNIYDVLLIFQQESPHLRAGMTANVEFVTQRREKVLTLPISSLGGTASSPTLTKVTIQNKGVVEISLGASDGQFVEVIGIEKTDGILVDPVNLSDPSQSGSPFSFGRKRPKGDPKESKK